MPKIHVALVANERYMFPLLAAAASVAVFSEPETELVFHLFVEAVKDETFSKVAGELRRLHPCQVIRHDCDMKRIDSLNLASWRGTGGTKNVWIRTFFCELLPDVDWCVYLDCDVLCLLPIERLYAERDDAYLAVAVKDASGWMRAGESKWIADKTGEDFDEGAYFNAGVLLMNLRKMREVGVASKVVAFTRQYGCPHALDQTTLNAILHRRVKLVDQRYNCAQFSLVDVGGFASGVIVHYCGGTPWGRSPFTPMSKRLRFWHAFCKRWITPEYYRRFRRASPPWPIFFEKMMLYVVLKSRLCTTVLGWIFDPMMRRRSMSLIRDCRRAWVEWDCDWTPDMVGPRDVSR